ncbi:MAG: PorV/PorQ family protein [Ignavibacteria bacterium]
MKNIKISLLVVLLILVAAGSAFADGGNRNGTAGATQLLIPVGARGIALGGATITSATGLDALYWNPAGLARSAKATNITFSQMNYIADIGVAYGAVSTNIDGFGAVALSIKSLSMDGILKTTVENPDGTGQTFKPEMITIGLTYAKALSDRIAVGLTANYISETLDLVKASGIGFNVGISYQNLGSIDGLSFAIVIKNLGPQMQYDGTGLLVSAAPSEYLRNSQLYKVTSQPFDLPSALELGLGYNYKIDVENQLNFSGVFNNANYYGDEYKAGVEYSYNKSFFVRGGYLYTADVDKNQVFGFSAGAGIDYEADGYDVKVDYAFRNAKFFSGNHVFAVSLGF